MKAAKVIVEVETLQMVMVNVVLEKIRVVMVKVEIVIIEV